MFATLTVGGETKKFTASNRLTTGLVDYYDETGKSAKKFLVRKPVLAGIMRSGFGLRRHPILGYTKMHTGVDWAARAARRFTPPATASWKGRPESGYGESFVVRHTNGYETAYGHMTGLCARHRRRHARAPGPGDRLCWIQPVSRQVRTCTTRIW